MVKHLSLIVFIFLMPTMFLKAQEDHLFEINGTINGVDSGFVQIWRPNVDSTFRVAEVKVPIVKGKFHFNGYLESPHWGRLTIHATQVLEPPPFIIDPGTQNLRIDIENDNLSLASSALNFQEYVNHYKPKIDSFKLMKRNLFQTTEDFKNDSLLRIEQGLKIQKDTFVLQYIKTAPYSYIGANGLLRLISDNGYSPIYDSSFSYLNQTLQQAQIGEEIRQALETVKRLEKGKIFPNFELLDTTNQVVHLNQIELKEYTLIDFWFNSCGYCILEFPKLKELYANYQDKGFEIISISTDLSRFESDWKKAIQKHELSWPQYWDVDHLQSSALEIHYFPTTFLINKKGEILAKNIDLGELAVFLATNLKK